MTDALKDGGYSAGARVNHFQAEAGNVTWVTWECQLEDIRTPGTVSAGGPTGSGGVGWPFSTAHKADGSPRVDDATLEWTTDLHIKALGVGTAQIADNAVTAAKIATSVAGSGLTGGGGSALAVNPDNSSIEIVTDEVRVKSTGIMPAHLNAAVAGAGLVGGGGSALAVNPDNATLGLAGDVLMVASAGIGHTQLGHRPSARIGVTGASQTATKEAWTRVDFDDSEWNTLPGAVTGTGASWKYTASRTQILRVSAIVDLFAVAGGGGGGGYWAADERLYLRLRHYDDSAATTRTYLLAKSHAVADPAVASDDAVIAGTTLVKLDTDDYLYVEVWHNEADDADIEGDTAISIEEV